MFRWLVAISVCKGLFFALKMLNANPPLATYKCRKSPSREKKIMYVADTFGSGNNMHSKSLITGLSMHQQPAK